MRIVLFCHSLVSDWNHGNAHFLRGVVTDLGARGHEVAVYEPAHGWSRTHLLEDAGQAAIAGFHRAFPHLHPIEYDAEHLDLDRALDGAALVLVHEWTDPALVRRIGRHRAAGGRYTLLFHDSHHRSVSDTVGIAAMDLEAYDGVLAFGEVIRRRYLEMGWGRRAFTWHEAADIRVFSPRPWNAPCRDLVWIGNWGDEERAAELDAYLMAPVRALGLAATVHGVGYPPSAREALADAGIAFDGWLPNAEAPAVYARHRVTVHIPRRPYVRTLRGVPTIRVFEALACGIPLISSPWDDVEGLFTVGQDFLIARDPEDMTRLLRDVIADRARRNALAISGLATIRARHTCGHRVDELLQIHGELSRATPHEAAAV